MKKYLILVGIALAMFGADQVTKIWAQQNLASRFPGRQSEAKPIELTVSEDALSAMAGGSSIAGYIDATYSLTSQEEAQRMVSRRAVSVNGLIERDPSRELISGDRITIHERQVEVVPGFWSFRYVENRGAAWGFLSGVNDWWRVPFFVTVSLLAMAMLLFLAAKAPKNAYFLSAGLGFLMGGAIGNFVDRIRLSYVIDFVDWYYKGHHWPTFNIADAAISIGVAIIFLEMIFGRGKDLLIPAQAAAAAAAPAKVTVEGDGDTDAATSAGAGKGKRSK